VRYRYRTPSGILSMFNYSVEVVDGGAMLPMAVEYAVPSSVADKVGLAIVEQLNERTGTNATENIKIILE